MLFGRDADWCGGACSVCSVKIVTLCRYDVAANRVAFAGGGVAVFDPQDNDVTCSQPCCNISGICRVMLDSSIGDAVTRLAAVARLQNVSAGGGGGRSRMVAVAAACVVWGEGGGATAETPD